ETGARALERVRGARAADAAAALGQTAATTRAQRSGTAAAPVEASAFVVAIDPESAADVALIEHALAAVRSQDAVASATRPLSAGVPDLAGAAGVVVVGTTQAADEVAWVVAARAAGCPVIAVDPSRAAGELLGDGAHGLVITDRDPRSVAEAILAVAWDADLRARLTAR
ncbi:MAG: glycosyltransferase family 4 protein, partial [Coriobacteriia bacterium]|nr:glycosyltransferase family 4 protein [Coriobacteriia bacterium]